MSKVELHGTGFVLCFLNSLAQTYTLTFMRFFKFNFIKCMCNMLRETDLSIQVKNVKT